MTRPRRIAAAIASLVAAGLIAASNGYGEIGEPPPQAAEAADGQAEVKLTKVDHDGMIKAIAANKKAKYTIVDAWATWCTPCMENFPHVVDMHKKYAGKGLAVCSLSLDDGDDSAKALEFLKKQKAVFANFIAKDADEIFDKLGVQAIPAVFVYGPDGKLVKKFTMDDPSNQFTYKDVEKYVQNLLAGNQ